MNMNTCICQLSDFAVIVMELSRLIIGTGSSFMHAVNMYACAIVPRRDCHVDKLNVCDINDGMSHCGMHTLAYIKGPRNNYSKIEA